MRKNEKEALMEAVLGKNAKRRTIYPSDFSVGKSETEALNDMLKQQSEQLNQMMKESSFTEEDFQKLKKEIETDFGITLDESMEVKTQTIKKIMSAQTSQELSALIKNKYSGQDEFVDRLIQAIRKPFVFSNEKDEPLFKLCLCGQEGTGKRSILKQCITELASQHYLSSDQLGIVDLSRYESAENEQLFVQDVYAALRKADIILFEKLEKVSSYLLPTLEIIVSEAKLPLKKRYVTNKKTLQEASNTLSASIIDTLSFEGKGIIVEADETLTKLYGLCGTGFFKGFDQLIETDEFDRESLKQIAQKKLDEFVLESTKANLEVTYRQDVLDYLVKQYKKQDGIHSFEEELESWMKSLVELKINLLLEEIKQVVLLVENDELQVELDGVKRSLVQKTSEYQLQQEQEILAELNEIVGLKEVKDYILSLKDHFRIQKLRAQKGLKTGSVSMHMIFTGNPGTGKTTIARLISRYLKAIGILSSGQLVEVTRADLVGRYVGHTAPQVQQVMKSAMGGVLFIDEAYSLYRGKDDSFGLEAIDTLVKGMEDHRDDLLVILAGYTKEMQEFLTSNSGLKSRFPNVIEFPDYTAQELLDITKSIVKGKQYVLNSDCDQKLLDYFEKVQLLHAKDAGNGRLARNLVEAAILKQSTRCLSDESAQLDELKAEDFDLSEVM